MGIHKLKEKSIKYQNLTHNKDSNKDQWQWWWWWSPKNTWRRSSTVAVMVAGTRNIERCWELERERNGRCEPTLTDNDPRSNDKLTTEVRVEGGRWWTGLVVDGRGAWVWEELREGESLRDSVKMLTQKWQI